MIDPHTIERILDAADIGEVISEFISLKRRGVNYLGLCPFHNEKTPSFIVSPAKGIFKCFGCGKGGNVVNFVMEHEHYTYVEALRFLAKKYNIEIAEKEETPEEIAKRNNRESLMIVSSFAQKYFSEYLWKENEGRAVGLGYFRERGMRDDMIQKFELGFCPDQKDAFTQAALKQGYKMEFLTETGLTIKRDEWIRDRFGGRVLFPIHNVAGRVIGFGGRTLSTDKNTAKYLNSPESDIYHKSRVLYGIFQAKRSITKKDKCYLVEGYTDVISFHQAGIENVVASSGTSLTEDQIRLIARFTKNITVIYDGDQAGIKASIRGIDMILEQGINVKVVPLPDGEDPDSFSKSMSATQLAEFIEENETDFIKFKTQLLLENAANDPIARAQLIGDIVRSIAIIPDQITQTVYIQECSKLMNVKEEVLFQEIKKISSKQVEERIKKERREQFRASQKKEENTPLPPPDFFLPDEGAESAQDYPAQAIVQLPTAKGPNPCDIEERELLRLILKFGNHELFEYEDEETGKTEKITVGEFIISEIDQDDITSDDPLYQRFFDATRELLLQDSAQKIDRFFIHNPDIELSQLASNLAAEKHQDSKLWSKKGSHIETEEDVLSQLIPKAIQEYKLRKVRHFQQAIMTELSQTNPDDLDKQNKLMERFHHLKKVEKELSELLGRRTINF